jgi:hypothetical protein
MIQVAGSGARPINVIGLTITAGRLLLFSAVARRVGRAVDRHRMYGLGTDA